MRAAKTFICAALLTSVCLGASAPPSPVQLPFQPQQGTSGAVPAGVLSYLVDARSLDKPIAAFDLKWPDDAAEFAGRLQVEAGEDRNTWRKVLDGAPIANLHVDGKKLIEQRVEFSPTQAKFWRLSWAGAAPSFALTAVRAEPAVGQGQIKRSKLAVNGKPMASRPGEFVFDLGASVPVDRINLQLPGHNSIVRVELQSRTSPADSWRPALEHGFYRLETRNGEMRNGPVAIAPTADRYWLAKLDEHSGELGNGVPRLQVEWVPQPVPRKTPWLWIVFVLGVALLLAVVYRLLSRSKRV